MTVIIYNSCSTLHIGRYFMVYFVIELKSYTQVFDLQLKGNTMQYDVSLCDNFTSVDMYVLCKKMLVLMYRKKNMTPMI